jgi:hypothetical protein
MRATPLRHGQRPIASAAESRCARYESLWSTSLLGFHDLRRSAMRLISIPLKRFKGEKHEHHTNSYFRARHRAGDKSQGGEKVCTNERDEQIRGSTAG